MSEFTHVNDVEELEFFSDVCLPMSSVDMCSVWGAEESSVTSNLECPQEVRCGQARVNRRCSALLNERNRPQPPHLSSPSAKCATSPLCEPRVDHARRVLVSEVQSAVLLEDRPRMVSPNTVLLSNCSTSPPLTEYSLLEHQPSSTHSLCHDHVSSQIFDNLAYYSSSSYTKPCSPNDSVSSSHYENYDSDVSFSHLICPHNIDDFGADVSYGNEEAASSSTSPQQIVPGEDKPDFSFIDEIYECVKAEINAEKTSSSLSSVQMRVTPTITLSVDQPLTIVGRDGEEYRVVLQTVKETGAELKRKADTSAVSRPASKRSKGVPLADLTIEEISNRKREQNRIAAQRYREKQKRTKCTEKEEEERLERRNTFLRSEAIRLQEEIAGLKKALLGSFGGSGNG